MQATLVVVQNPFYPAVGRKVTCIRQRRRVDKLAPGTRLPFVCILNGEPLLRAEWSRTRLSDGDVLSFVTLPQGGGGGGGGKDPLRTIAMIAVIYATAGLGGALLGIEGAAALGGLGVAVANATVTLIAMAIVDAVLPAPKLPTPMATAAMSAPSPTYNVQAQGNTARLGSAIPVQYGRHIAYPDFAAEPYGEFVGNEQYLYQLFCIGQGYHAIESIRFEDTPVSSFAEVTYEVTDPGGTVTLFPTNVASSSEVSGQEALTSVYLGPFVATGAGITADHIAVDMVCPRGLYYANNDGSFASKSVSFTVEARTIDNNGAPTSVYSALATETITAATNTPQRVSFRYAVGNARYEVRLVRNDTKDESTRAGHELNWAGLRAYIPGTQNYGNVTMLAMRVRASNNISQASSRKVNVTATRKLPIWNGTTWSAPTATRSIAWAITDACKNTDYGAKIADSRQDLAALLALDAIWTARGDTFDARFDSSMTFWEALQKIARAGRAKPFQQSGLIHVVRDQEQLVPTAMFSPRNTVRGSLKIDYLMPTAETADAIEVEFFNEETWATDTVTASLPGSTESVPAKVQLFGVTNRNQAWREGMYIAACNRYRRKPITLTTEMEGFIPSYGDLVSIASERLTAAQFGELTGWNAGTKTATLSEPVVFGSGTHYMGLRKRDGSFSGPWTVTAGATSREVVFAVAPDFTPYTGSREERTHFSFGIATEYRQLAVVLAARPRGNNVELSFINEYIDGSGVQYVHHADEGAVPTALALWQLPKLSMTPDAPTNLILTETLVAINNIVRAKLDVSWTPAAGAEAYRVAWRLGTGNWNTFSDRSTSSVEIIDIPVGLIQVRVESVRGINISAAALATKTVYGKTAAPSNISGFSVTKSTGVAIAEWALPTDLDVRIGGAICIRHAQVTTGTLWESGIIVQEFDGNSVTGVLPLMTGTYMAKARDSSGNWSVADVQFVMTEGMVTGFTTVATTTQSPGFVGAKTNVAAVGGELMLDSVLTISEMTTLISTWPTIGAIGGISNAGTYEFDNYVDLSTVLTRRFEADIDASSYDTGDTISQRGLVSLWDSLSGATINDCDATLYVATTDDNPAVSPAWGAWTPFFVGDFTCRAAKFKLDLESGTPTHNIKISALQVDVKVPV